MAWRARTGALVALAVCGAPVAAAAPQRYAPSPAAIAPVPMAASCLADASALIDVGAAWLLVEMPETARAAFERAADLDPDCALGYWGQALSRFADADAGSAAAVAAIQASIARGASVPARTAFERAALTALGRLAAREAAPGVPAAWPARAAAYREALCAGAAADRTIGLWCARALADAAVAPGPAPGAAAEALRLVAARAGDAPLDVGAAVIVLEVAPDPGAPLVTRALEAIAAANPPAPAPHAFAARTAVRRGDWPGVAASAGRARAIAPDAVSGDLVDAEIEALFQPGRRADAYARAGQALTATPDAAARAFARVALADRRLDGRGLGDRATLPLPAAAAGRWPVVFVNGLDDALRAWPGGDAALVARARAAMTTLEAVAEGEGGAEAAWARTIVEAAIAASQDEHPQMALLFTHAAGLEARLLASGRPPLLLVPARELAAELWLRTYRYDDARREARAVLAVSPHRISPYVVLARTADRVHDEEESAEAWRTVLTLRQKADANDSLQIEALRALDRLSLGRR